MRYAHHMAACDLIAVYILASRRNGTLYIGVTSDLFRRMHEHRKTPSTASPANTAAARSSGGSGITK